MPKISKPKLIDFIMDFIFEDQRKPTAKEASKKLGGSLEMWEKIFKMAQEHNLISR